MDITPLIPAGRQVIEAYGAGGIRVSGTLHTGSILVFADRTMPWPVARPADLAGADFAPVLAHGNVAILLLGCGARMALLPAALRQELRAHGIVIDAMDTGAACRTYNILLAEERRVAAALIGLG